MTPTPNTPPRSSSPGAATSPPAILPAGGGISDMDELIAKAKTVVGLWDLMLFSNGNAAARQKRADVMHVAVSNLQSALLKQSERVAR